MNDISTLVEAATVARNEANARGDYSAPYVSRLSAALAPFDTLAPWRDEPASTAPAQRRASSVLEVQATVDQIWKALNKPLCRMTTERDAEAYERAARYLRTALGELERLA